MPSIMTIVKPIKKDLAEKTILCERAKAELSDLSRALQQRQYAAGEAERAYRNGRQARLDPRRIDTLDHERKRASERVEVLKRDIRRQHQKVQIRERDRKSTVRALHDTYSTYRMDLPMEVRDQIARYIYVAEPDR